MDVLLHMESNDFQKVRELLLNDDIVSRASIVFKDAKEFEREGYYCYIAGVDEQCKRALKLIKIKNEETGEVTELAKEVTGEEKENVINKIKEEENRAVEGFGGIFAESERM